MFGFQRTADSLWAAADQMTRGFLIGATAGRTTLNGEGLQHEDGHSHLIAATNPAVVAYDPAFGFEIGHIVRDGLRRMYGEDSENIYYYLTMYNEPIDQPAEPEDLDVDGLLRGLYRYQPARRRVARPARAGAGQWVGHAGRAARAAAARRRLGCERRRLVGDVVGRAAPRRADDRRCQPARSPASEPQTAYVTRVAWRGRGPVVAVSDYQRAVQELIRPWVPGDYVTLGTDGFGLSDTRGALRRHFRIDAEAITVRTLARARPSRRGQARDS